MQKVHCYCIDVGNTRTKIAVFPFDLQHDLKNFSPICLKNISLNAKAEVASTFKELNSSYNCRYVIFSSVNKPEAVAYLSNFLPTNLLQTINLQHHTPIPITNKYDTPHTLGIDRLAAVIGAHALYPHRPAFVIDAGTCLTTDFIDEQGNYLGGSIAPGIKMQLKALPHFTARLPLVAIPENLEQPPLIGNTTNNSILSGTWYNIQAAMQQRIQAHIATNPNLIALITGGEAHYFYNGLKKWIFAAPYLVLQGLYKILIYNVAQLQND